MESGFRFLLEFHNNCDFWSKGTGIWREFSILSHLMRGAKRLYFLTPPLTKSPELISPLGIPQTPSILPFSSSLNKTNSHRVLRTLFFCYCWQFLDMVEVVWITNGEIWNFLSIYKLQAECCHTAAVLQSSCQRLIYICICILYLYLYFIFVFYIWILCWICKW